MKLQTVIFIDEMLYLQEIHCHYLIPNGIKPLVMIKINHM